MNYCFISGFSQPSSTLEILANKMSSKKTMLTSPEELYPNYIPKLNEQIKDKCVLVGWSMGGSIVLEYASTYPEKVEKIILISSTASFLKNKDNEIGIEPARLEALSNGIVNSKETALKRFISKFSSKSTHEYLKNALKIKNDILIHNLNYFKKDLRFIAKEIKIKTLIFHDKQDKIIPFSHAEKLHNLLQNSELFTTNEFGHILEEENSKFIALQCQK